MRAPTQATTPYEEIVTQSEVFLCFSLNSYKSNSKRTHEGISATAYHCLFAACCHRQN